MVDKFCENGVIIPENLMKKDVDVEAITTACAKMVTDDVLWETESTFHSISICENPQGRFMRYGISFQAGRVDTPFYKGNIPYLNYFLIPYLLKKNAKKILVIGFGTGILIKQYEKLFNNLEQIDAVDIEENILSIASRFFDFEEGKNFHFHLQDALVFLRNNKTKYDIIITDVAGNEGVDKRFFENEFFNNIKKSLKKDGIFAFNSCSNINYDENENEFFGFTVKKYKEYFKNFAVFDGQTSDMLFYKIFYDIHERLIDVTNAIIIASDDLLTESSFKNYSKKDFEKVESIGVNLEKYLKDLHKIYTT